MGTSSLPGLSSRGLLQRGRARAGAEWNVASSTWPCHVSLQRGRARAGAEWIEQAEVLLFAWAGFNGAAPARARNAYKLSGGAVAQFKLQRGRAGAECTMPPGLATCHIRFNGAAPARARNVAAEIGAMLGADELQRGRARAGAE